MNGRDGAPGSDASAHALAEPAQAACGPGAADPAEADRGAAANDATPAYYTFERTGTLVGLLAGIVPHKVASLSVPSWNQVLGWLKEMDTLRKATELTAQHWDSSVF